MSEKLGFDGFVSKIHEIFERLPELPPVPSQSALFLAPQRWVHPWTLPRVR